MIPAGYRLVPEELTDEMYCAVDLNEGPAYIWETLLNSAPEPPSPWRRTSETPPPNDGSKIIWMSAAGNACIVYDRQVPPLSSGYWKPTESYWMPLSELPPLPKQAPTLREAAEEAARWFERWQKGAEIDPWVESADVLADLKAALAREGGS